MPTDAHSLHCPNCGAVAEPGSGRCPYCRARLATVSCPSCFARIFDGAAFCSSCGARRTRTETAADAAQCPSCKGALTLIEVGTTPLLECAACDGIWMDASAFEALCTSSESQAAVLHRLAERTPVPANARVKYRPCLRCGKMMNRVNFGRISGTIVDVCRGDGTFMDAGELHAILDFIRSGGLDRTRRRQIEDLRDAERRLRDRQAAEMRRPADGDGFGTTRTISWGADDIAEILKALKW